MPASPILLPTLRLAGKPALVAGAGAKAAECARGLVALGAVVTVATPQPGTELRALISEGTVRHLNREFAPRDLSGCGVVVAADEPVINGALVAAARAAGIPCADALDPTAGDLELLPAAGLGPVALAARASAPALARLLSERAGAGMSPEFFALVEKLTATLLATADDDYQRRIFTALLDSDAATLLVKGEGAKAEALALRIVGQTTRALR